ncbi:MAG: hypothetical protein P1V19_17880, partial [Gimesia sp.]|nr:hypothetical protein [Gimesia sp.]
VSAISQGQTATGGNLGGAQWCCVLCGGLQLYVGPVYPCFCYRVDPLHVKQILKLKVTGMVWVSLLFCKSVTDGDCSKLLAHARRQKIEITCGAPHAVLVA